MRRRCVAPEELRRRIARAGGAGGAQPLRVAKLLQRGARVRVRDAEVGVGRKLLLHRRRRRRHRPRVAVGCRRRRRRRRRRPWRGRRGRGGGPGERLLGGDQVVDQREVAVDLEVAEAEVLPAQPRRRRQPDRLRGGRGRGRRRRRARRIARADEVRGPTLRGRRVARADELRGATRGRARASFAILRASTRCFSRCASPFCASRAPIACSSCDSLHSVAGSRRCASAPLSVHRQRELAARPEALAQAVPRVDQERVELDGVGEQRLRLRRPQPSAVLAHALPRRYRSRTAAPCPSAASPPPPPRRPPARACAASIAASRACVA